MTSLAAPGTAQHARLAQSGRPVIAEAPWVDSSIKNRPAWIAPLASVIIPGSGQFIRGDDRAALYIVSEAYLAAGFLSAWSEGRREGTRFRDLAFSVSRSLYSPSIRDTVFEYFEQMGKFAESGDFDTDPGPALVPPNEASTYNGSIWALARRTYFANPDSVPDPLSTEYQRALEFYRKRAVGPSFQWSWRNAGLEEDLFRQTIRHSDDAFRRAQRQIGLMLANHLISAVDVYISQRLRAGKRNSGRVRSAVWAVPQDLSASSVRIWLVLRVSV